MSTFNRILNANAKPYTSPIGIGKNQARRLAALKRRNALQSGQGLQVPHMAGSFGYKQPIIIKKVRHKTHHLNFLFSYD